MRKDCRQLYCCPNSFPLAVWSEFGDEIFKFDLAK